MSELDSEFSEEFESASEEKTMVSNSKTSKKSSKQKKLEVPAEETNTTLLDAFDTPISDVSYENIENYDFEKELGASSEAETTAEEDNSKDSISYLEETLNKYEKDFQKDVKLSVGNLKEKSLMEASIKAKWASTLQAERTKGKLLAKTRDNFIEKLRTELSETAAVGSYLAAKQQIETALNSNPTLKRLRQEIADNRQVVELLEMYWQVVQGFGFTIKNSIETLKLDMGI